MCLHFDSFDKKAISQVAEDTAEVYAKVATSSAAAGETPLEEHAPWYMDIFKECGEDDTPLTAEQTRRATMEKLGLRKKADASNELRTAGFNLEASNGKARCVRFKFPGSNSAVVIARK